MDSQASIDDQLVTRSEIAGLVGLRRPAITNWESRHHDFPKPVRAGGEVYFRRGEILAWLDTRPIPPGTLHRDEEPGTTYADRARKQLSATDTATDRLGGADGDLVAGSHHPEDLQELLGPLAGRVRGAGTSADYLQLLASLIFLKAAEPDTWWRLVHVMPTSGDADRAALLLTTIGETVDRRLRDFGLLPGMKAVFGGLHPASIEDLARVVHHCGRLGREVFPLLLARYEAESKLDSNEFFTPDDVAQVMAEILLTGEGPDRRLYDPYARGGELLVAAAGRAAALADVRGDSPHAHTLRLAGMSLVVHGRRAKLHLVTGSPWHARTWPRQAADLIITNPPFNGTSSPGVQRVEEDWPFGPPPPGNDNFAWLQHVFASLAVGGRAAVVMPNTAGTSAHQRERGIRQGLVAQGAVECVIALPPKLFTGTPIAVSVWILRKTPHPDDQVLLINAHRLGTVAKGRRTLSAADRIAITQAYLRFREDREDGRQHAGIDGLSIAVDAAQIDGPDYSLNPLDHQIARDRRATANSAMARASASISNLVEREAAARNAETKVEQMVTRLLAPGPAGNDLPSGWRLVRLRELCDITAGPSHSRLPQGHRTDQDGVVLVLPKHLLHGGIDAAGDIRITHELARSLDRFRVEPGDILCARSGSTGSSALVTNSQAGWVFSTNLLRLRQLEAGSIDSLYLRGYLSLPDVQEWIKGRSEATAIASISASSFGQLEVVLPPLPTQRRIGQALQALDEQVSAYRALVAAAADTRAVLAEHLLSGALDLQPDLDTIFAEILQERRLP